MKRKIVRLIDVNINRAKEAARVCEEIVRFVLEDKKLAPLYKKLRHKITENAAVLSLSLKELLSCRDTEKDVGRKTITSENSRKDINDIFSANIQRLKESIRVLEEFSKIINKHTSQSFKDLRFSIYALEKKTFKKLSALCNSKS